MTPELKSRLATPQSGAEDSAETGPSTQKTDIFETLAHPRRQYLIRAIDSESEEVEIGELAEQVAAWELGIEPDEVSSRERKRLYTSIQQHHLPRLDEGGIVEFDPDRGVVNTTTEFEDVEMYLEIVHGNELPWSEVYVGLSSVFIALTAVVYVGIWPFSVVPPVIWLAVAVITMAAAASCHYFQVLKWNLGTESLTHESESSGDST
jgi:hypothetical protein